MSAKPCGCDSAVDWYCERHAQVIAEIAHKWRVEDMHTRSSEEQAEAPRQDLSFGGAVTGNVAVEEEPVSITDDNSWMFVDATAAATISTEDWLRNEFPHGHKHYLPVALKQLELHSQKNWDYASGGDPLGNFDRVAAILGNYPNLKLSDRRVVALVYALKQIDAVLWGINSNITQKVEGLDSRLDDIAVYATIVQCMNSEVVK